MDYDPLDADHILLFCRSIRLWDIIIRPTDPAITRHRIHYVFTLETLQLYGDVLSLSSYHLR